MKKNYTVFLILLLSGMILPQAFQGPAIGNLASGIIQSTESMDKAEINTAPSVYQSPEFKMPPSYIDFPVPSPKEGSNYKKDPAFSTSSVMSTDSLVSSWIGITMTNSIPPDPSVAVGPSHVVACANTTFSIWDKEGHLLKTISGTSWVGKSISNADVVCDPKIVYDHFAKRWIMVWMTVNTAASTSFWCISVSKDSVPLGTWYTWATPTNVNGSTTVSNYSDYQGVGYDKDVLYICANQFTFAGSFAYSKLRIIPKAQLFNNTPNAITWTDIWDIRRPGGSNQTFGIRPAIIYGEPSEGYLVWCNSGNSNYFSIFKVNNPLSQTPSITGSNVPVTAYTLAPNATQLGGVVNYLLETNGSRLTNEPVYRDGKIWVAHSVLNPSDQTTSAVHYLKMDVATSTAEEDVVYGNDYYWYCYPTIMVDKELNMALGFSRSSETEYMGAFYASKKASDNSLGESKPLQEGKGNYEVTYSGTRNRWGDYMGIALDPSDEQSIWMHTEYASATNKWGTYIGRLLAKPFAGAYISTQATSLDFGNASIGGKGDTISVTLSNFGADNLVITDIPSVGAFKVINKPTLPLSLPSYNSVTFQVTFEPSVKDSNIEIIPVVSNATNFTGIKVRGFAFNKNSADLNTLYATTGSAQNGEFYKLNSGNGASTLLGPSTFTEVRGVAIDPKTKFVYGMSNLTNGTNILSIDPVTGTAYKIYTLPILDMKAMAFDTTGVLYIAEKTGKLYRLEVETRKYAYVCSVKTNILSMAFNPKDNVLWGVASANLGIKDKVFRINTSTGDTTIICRTGVNVVSNALAFDNTGNIYVTTGAATVNSNLYRVDTLTSTSTLVGNTGIKNITDLAFSYISVSGINETGSDLPKDYSLLQNYPNPFNPSTVIEYQLPMSANVKITVFNILGQKVKELVNGYKEAGSYKVNWNASSASSGIYFYEMKAVSQEGKEFSSIRKMILVK